MVGWSRDHSGAHPPLFGLLLFAKHFHQYLTWFSQQPYQTPEFQSGNQGSETSVCSCPSFVSAAYPVFFPMESSLGDKYLHNEFLIPKKGNGIKLESYAALSDKLISRCSSFTNTHFYLVSCLRKGRVVAIWMKACLVIFFCFHTYRLRY